MKVQKVYLLQQSQILGNPTQCLLRHSQAYKVQKAEPPRCLALRTRGGRLCTCKVSQILEGEGMQVKEWGGKVLTSFITKPSCVESGDSHHIG